MKNIFRKAITVLGTAALVGSTVGMAAAAAYPAPFVQSGASNVAIVYGSNAAISDVVGAANIASNLATKLAAQTASGSTTSASISGEAAALFTSSSKINVNDSLNQVKSVLTKTELPTVLVDGSFSGNVDATYTQTIVLGSNPRITFAKQPTSNEDPMFGLTTSTSTSTPIYNASVTFNKAVNLTHADSEGEDLILFGQKFTIASATSATSLVLLKTAEKISITSDEPTAEVTISGEKYTIELISASDTSATIRVTDSSGKSETKEINENASKKVQGITIAVTTADETNLRLSASVVAGAEKVTMTSGSAVTVGEDDTVIDGTKATFTGGTEAMTKLDVSVAAADSDEDAILPGGSFTDPVFGTFKVDFSSLNIPEDSTLREDIAITTSGDDKLQMKMTSHTGDEANVQWAINTTAGTQWLQHDSDGRNITVFEEQSSYRNDYIVVGNEDEGYLLKVSTITNQTTGYSQDKVKFTDVFSGSQFEATLTAEGTGTVTIGGKVYNLEYNGSSSLSEDSRSIKLNYPDSTAAQAVIYPTIQTSKGAKVAFYEPIVITNLSDWDGAGTALTTLRFPDGDGYTDITVLSNTTGGNVSFNAVTLDPTVVTTANATIGTLKYTATFGGYNNFTINLVNPQTGALITDPALVIFEEKDDNTVYNAMVVTIEPGNSGDDGIGVDDVIRTWGADATWDAITLSSDSKKTKEADLYGSIITIDSGDSDQKTATISYPDEQLYAQIYVGEDSAEITGGTASGGTATELGAVTVEDSEVASVASKNLIVVGGSCINSVAASLLGQAACGNDFTTLTDVAAGEFLIESFDRSGKTAILVAGYNAADTTKAVTYLTNNAVTTTVGTKLKGTSATEATVVTA